MHVFLTGATGHLGRNLVPSLLDAGHRVTALVRGDTGLDPRVHTVRGDLLDALSLVRAGRGCDATIHCAAVYTDDPGRSWEMARASIIGTQHVLDAAAANGHRRVVLASSMVTVGFGDSPDDRRDEDDWNERPFHPYFRAKVDGERVAWRHADELGVPLVVLCPGGLIGPGDHRTTPTMAFLAELANGTAQTLAGGVNYVDVRDVADAFTTALTEGRPGARYLLTGECLSMRELGQLMRLLTGRRPVHLPLPRRLVLGMAWLTQPDRYPMAWESVDRWPSFRCDRAREELAFYPRPVEEALADAVRWLALQGALSPEALSALDGRLDPHLHAPEEALHVSV